MNLLDSKALVLRSKYLRTIRRFLDESGFLEVDTPVLKKIVGMEPFLDPFQVSSPSREETGYLITSPEYSMKMILSAGLDKIYEITHVFRSGEKGSPIHSPEFLMLELYATGWKDTTLMDFMDSFFSYLNRHFVTFQGTEELQEPKDASHFPEPLRLSNEQAFVSATGRSWRREDLILTLEERGIFYSPNDRYEDLYYLVFLNLVENSLPRGLVYLYDYPPECGALARIEKGVAKRFEIYWDGVELANAFYELTDVEEQRERFREEQNLRKSLGKEIFPIDEDFMSCMETGMPDSAGISLGLDRILMKILGKEKISEVSPYRFLNTEEGS